jgi:hypothetical protein
MLAPMRRLSTSRVLPRVEFSRQTIEIKKLLFSFRRQLATPCRFILIDLLYRLKPKGNSSIDTVGQIYLEWVRFLNLNRLYFT